MEKVLYKTIVKYFSHLKTVSDTWSDVITSAHKQIDCLKSLSHQYRLITSAKPDKVEILKEEGVKEKLILKIFRAIQNEIVNLGNSLNGLNNLNQDLKNKFTRIEEARNNVSIRDPEMKQLINGTPLIPRLENLLLWAKESQDYFTSLFSDVYEKFNSVDCTDEDTIINLEESFHINYFWQTKIDKILRFTNTL